MRFWTERSLRTRLVLGLVAILLISQLGFTFLRTSVTQYNYDRAMQQLASVKFAAQGEAIASNPEIELPATVEPRFQRVDLIWRAPTNVITSVEPGSDATLASRIRMDLDQRGVDVLELHAVFAPSTKFDAIEGAGGRRYRGPVPPMETLIAARFPGVDGWITARLRAGPPPPPVTALDLLLNVGVVLVLGLFGIVLVSREIHRSLADLRTAVDRVGPGGADAEIRPSGPAEFHPVFVAFNRMSRRVRELLSEKDVMLGAIGHDLRTPLTSLRLTLENMGPVDAKERAIATIDHAGGVLEDILELARADNVAPPTTRYNIEALLDDLVAEAEERGEDVIFDTRGRVTALCRPESLRRMVQNLMTNAVKYAGNARLSLRETEGRVIITVDDNGPGLPEDMLDQIMQPFQRGDASRNASAGGTGLGLTLAQAVARNHGGDLTLSNRVPHGLRAIVTLPTERKRQA